MKWIVAVALPALGAAGAWAVELKPQTVKAFERYVVQTEARFKERQKFPGTDPSEDWPQIARRGQTVVRPFGGKPKIAIEDGLVHDWVGCVFIPGATVAKTIALVQNYNQHKDLYQPELMDCRILSRSGNEFRVFMRLMKKKVITAVLDTEHEVHYYPIDRTHWRSVSKTTRVSEVEDAGKRQERVLPAGTGKGFLWKLYTYWRFEERDGGTWVECQAISLTRKVPFGFGWMIEPIIRDLPRESLESTLNKTRAALVP